MMSARSLRVSSLHVGICIHRMRTSHAVFTRQYAALLEIKPAAMMGQASPLTHHDYSRLAEMSEARTFTLVQPDAPECIGKQKHFRSCGNVSLIPAQVAGKLSELARFDIW